VALAFCRELHLPAESGTREPSDALSQGSTHAPGPRVDYEGVDLSGVRRSGEKMRSGSPKVTGVIALENAGPDRGVRLALPSPSHGTNRWQILLSAYVLYHTPKEREGRLPPAKRTRGQHA
jgi:hypothetical protein